MQVVALDDAVSEGRLALGTFMLDSSPETVEVFGQVGFSVVVIDHMLTAIDWRATADQIRAANLHGMQAYVRIQTSPWASQGQDMGIAAMMARAQSLGARGAMASFGSLEEIRRCLIIRSDLMHRKPYIHPTPSSEWLALMRELGNIDAAQVQVVPGGEDDFDVVPLIETLDMLQVHEQILQLPGIRSVGLGISDISKALAGGFEDNRDMATWDQDTGVLWTEVDKLTGSAQVRGVSVWSSTGRAYRRQADIQARILHLWEHGVNVVLIDTPQSILQPVLEDLLVDAYTAIGHKTVNPKSSAVRGDST